MSIQVFLPGWKSWWLCVSKHTKDHLVACKRWNYWMSRCQVYLNIYIYIYTLNVLLSTARVRDSLLIVLSTAHLLVSTLKWILIPGCNVESTNGFGPIPASLVAPMCRCLCALDFYIIPCVYIYTYIHTFLVGHRVLLTPTLSLNQY